MSQQLARFTSRPQGQSAAEWASLAESVIDSYAKKCAEVEANNAVLREWLDQAQSKVHALEAARVEKLPVVRWNFPHGCSPELSRSIQEGVIGHFYAACSMTDEQGALMFPGQAAAIGKDNMVNELLRQAVEMIRADTFRDERARVTVYRGELIIGALKPKE